MCDFRPADVAPLVVLLLLTACGDDSANTTDDDVDAGTVDVGADAECVGPACQRLEPVGTAEADCEGGWLAFTEFFVEGGVCVPRLSDWTCPSGFQPTVELAEHQVPDGTEPMLTPFTSCRPVLPPAACPPGSMPVFGRETCLRMGSECPPDGELWPDEQIIRSLAAPRQGRILYVHDRTLPGPGADGQRGNPYRSLAEAVDVAGSNDIIALSVGTHHADAIAIDVPLAIVGACTEGSMVSGSGGWELPVLALVGGGSSLVLRQVTMTLGAGLYVGNTSGRTTIGNVRFDLRTSPFGIWDAEGPSRIEMSNVYITGVTRRQFNAVEIVGAGLYLLHSELDAERVTITGGGGTGVLIAGGGSARLSEVIVQSSRGGTESDFAGNGIMAIGEGTTVVAERVLLFANDARHAVASLDGHLTLSDALILGRRPEQPSIRAGAGVVASAGGFVEGSQIMIENIGGTGVLASDLDSEVHLDHLIIRRDAGGTRAASLPGVEARYAGRASLSSVLIEGSDGRAVFATGGGSRVELSEALVIDTAAVDAAETVARALEVTEGGSVTANRCVVTGTSGTGALALGRGSTIDLTDAIVHDTRDTCAAEPGTCEGGAGLGVVAADNGAVALERFAVADSDRAGTLALAPGAITSRHGVIAGNTVGAAFNAAYADDETPWFAVRFVDNVVDRMLQAEARVPTPSAP